jgi:hypothetical protein
MVSVGDTDYIRVPQLRKHLPVQLTLSAASLLAFIAGSFWKARVRKADRQHDKSN